MLENEYSNVAKCHWKCFLSFIIRYLLLICKCKIGSLHAEMARSTTLIKADYHKQIFKLWSVKLKPYTHWHSGNSVPQYLHQSPVLYQNILQWLLFLTNMTWNIYLADFVQVFSFLSSSSHVATFETVILSFMKIYQPLLLS